MKKAFRLSTVLLLSAAPHIVAAQTVDTAPEAPQAPMTGDTGIEDIVVTANKRVENINKVGLTVTALSADALAARRISSLEDIARAVPGLDVAPSFGGTPILTLRGIGFNENSLGVYPAVSLYVDQAPLPFPVMTSHSAYDLERIEVLKGPQGTLFGQNSTGGAINYIAAKPTDELAAGGSISYGRFNEIEANAYLSGPITDTLGFRVAANGRHADDWQYSITRNDTNGKVSYVTGRAILEWTPSNGVEFGLNVNGWKDTSQPQALQLIGVRPQAPAFAGNFYNNVIFAPNSPRAADWTNQRPDPSTGVVDPATGITQPGTAKLVSFDPKGDRRFTQIALRGDIDITNDITLTSLTSYNHYKQKQVVDPDGSEASSLNIQFDDGKIESFNQELRLANAATNAFRWVLGINYEKSETNQYQLVRQFDTTAYNPSNLYINASGVTVDQDITNYAFFGSAELSLTDQLTAKAGVRYTNSSIDANTCSTTLPGGNVDTLFNFLGSILGSVPFTPVGPSDCYSLNENLVPGEPFIRSLNEDNVSWRIGLDYQVTPTTLFYGNVSRGYKAGSFPALAAALFTGLEPVTQESVTAYEVGIKTQMFDRRATLTGAAFYYDYKDKQVRGKLADPIFGNLDALINIPESRVWGAEAELAAQPIEGLSLSAAVTYLDSKIKRYVGVNIVGEPNFNSAGDPLPFTPKWSGVFNLDYQLRTNGGSPFVGVTATARTSSEAAISASSINYAGGAAAQVRPGVNCVYCIDGYATVDARLGYRADADKWSVWLWGKNIFNKYYWTNVIASYEAAARAAGMPATYGVTFGFKL
jgi:outer membrane receptor protein involved in Fe transport